MSYAGHIEYICVQGHYWSLDDYHWLDEGKKLCPFCKSSPRFYCSVNETNGFKQDGIASSWPGEKEEIGFDDDWKVDHYGNRYAVERLKYHPIFTGKNKWRHYLPDDS